MTVRWTMQTGVAAVITMAIVVATVCPRSARAASRTRTATASVTVAAVAKLSLSTTMLSFPDANPDQVPAIPSTGGPVTINTKVRTTPGSTVSLSVQASGDLRAGLATIPIAAVRWTATGTGFSGGTMSAAAAQQVAVWTGSGARSGTQAYTLTNSWTYATGSYSTTFVYTLTAP